MLDGFDQRSAGTLHGGLDVTRPAQSLGELAFGASAAEDSLESALRLLAASSRRVLSALRAERVRDEELSLARQLVQDLDLALRTAPRAPIFRLADDGSWFELRGSRVDLSRRCSVRRILAALIDQRRTGSNQPLDVHTLFSVGWPGERIPYESQVRRVYTAIWTLRRLGLDALLLTRDGGYLLDPKQSVAFAG